MDTFCRVTILGAITESVQVARPVSLFPGQQQSTRDVAKHRRELVRREGARRGLSCSRGMELALLGSCFLDEELRNRLSNYLF